MAQSKIGGEFSIDISLLNGIDLKDINNTDEEPLYATGRHAFSAILAYLKKDRKTKIYLPEYLCESILWCCQSLNWNIEYYELNNELQPSLLINDLDTNSVFLIINYFGLTDINHVCESIKKQRPDITIIADFVQAYYEPVCHLADYTFYSYRKFFGTFEGASVISNSGKDFDIKKLNENPSIYSKIIGALLKHNNADDRTYLSFFEKGEEILNATNICYKASRIAKYLYNKLDHHEIKKRRIENANFISREIIKMGITPLLELKDNRIPLFFPVKLKNRDSVRQKLFSLGIYLPIHWPVPDNHSHVNNEKYKNILSLVIDQRYSLKHMKYLIEGLRNIINN